jgi:hypothetical protein
MMSTWCKSPSPYSRNLWRWVKNLDTILIGILQSCLKFTNSIDYILHNDEGVSSDDENPPPIDCAILGGCGGGNDNEDEDDNGEDADQGDSENEDSDGNNDNGGGGDSEEGGDSLLD